MPEAPLAERPLNVIGTDASGTQDLGTFEDGVFVDGDENTVGGTTAGAHNIISANGSSGVIVAEGTGNRILSNSIHSNGGLGIVLEVDFQIGVTANDTGNGDGGENHLQNFPVLSSATSTGDKTTIMGALDSTLLKTFTIQFFSSSIADSSGHGEGKKLIGQKSVTTDVNGNASFTATIPVLPAGQVVSATATKQSTGAPPSSQ